MVTDNRQLIIELKVCHHLCHHMDEIMSPIMKSYEIETLIKCFKFHAFSLL